MRVLYGTVDHVGERPGWDCKVCGRPWPCAIARTNLLTEFRTFPSVLAIYMSAQMYDAVGDMLLEQAPTPTDTYDRFLAWIRDGHDGR